MSDVNQDKRIGVAIRALNRTIRMQSDGPFLQGELDSVRARRIIRRLLAAEKKQERSKSWARSTVLKLA